MNHTSSYLLHTWHNIIFVTEDEQRNIRPKPQEYWQRADCPKCTGLDEIFQMPPAQNAEFVKPRSGGTPRRHTLTHLTEILFLRVQLTCETLDDADITDQFGLLAMER
jgi:hypothetical protein